MPRVARRGRTRAGPHAAGALSSPRTSNARRSRTARRSRRLRTSEDHGDSGAEGGGEQGVEGVDEGAIAGGLVVVFEGEPVAVVEVAFGVGVLDFKVALRGEGAELGQGV